MSGIAESVSCSVSDGFHAWLAGSGGSIVLTTYQANRIGLIGFDGDRVRPEFRPFDEPMGLAVQGNELVLATGARIVRFANAAMLAPHYPTDAPGGYDALYLPRVTYHTGALRAHDVALGSDGGPWFVNTLFSCLAAPSTTYSFEPRWVPPFITKLAAEDRCHLNGMAMIDGVPRFVTALGATDAPAGWRGDKRGGGVLLNVPGGERIVTGLSMPHSPRWHHGALWLLNSGAGELCRVDLQAGRAQPVCALPGFLRGLSFAGRYAIIGLSRLRQSNLFGGLAINERFPRLSCGVAVVDLQDGRHVGMLEFTSGVHELFEAQFIAGVRRPMVLAPDGAEAPRAVSSPTIAYWMRPDPPPATP